MRLYRIARAKYAIDLSGEGSRLYGGRWTPPGYPAIYTSEHPALAAWENAVHFGLEEPVAPLDFRLIELVVPIDAAASVLDIPSIPHNPVSVGRDWLETRANDILLMRVPSVVIPLSWNIILNPRHPDAKQITVRDHGAFVFDVRLPFTKDPSP
ncbi:RES domain-containing protein [Aquisalimonas lutea]|uniref:RES family NAD+ phosphorylase n=1 Tax=Aquisalimonas lutea TaxID=1327750 RepID=UPI0025B321FE|nr:RES domain-containing protein [Aquisalimonas lutea]MDN3519741.1 RES domain-containing protein [Aquisalimonas lutea]